MVGGRRLWVWVWAAALVCVLGSRAVAADEEDPLQHEAQVAARERQLTRALELLAGEDEGAMEAGAGACDRDTLDFAVPRDQLAKFRPGALAGLRLANLLNTLYVGVPPGANPAYPARVFSGLVRGVVAQHPAVASAALAFLRGEYRAPAALGEADQDQDQVFGAMAWRAAGGGVAGAALATLHNASRRHLADPWLAPHTTRPTRRKITPAGPYEPLGSDDPPSSPSSPSAPPPPTASPGEGLTREGTACGCRGPSWTAVHPTCGWWHTRCPSSPGRTKETPLLLRAWWWSASPCVRWTWISVTRPPPPPPQRPAPAPPPPEPDLHLFTGTHKCHTSSTKCVPESGGGFRRGGYRCECHATHYLPSAPPHQQYFQGEELEAAHAAHASLDAFRCAPCPAGCGECRAAPACPVLPPGAARLAPLCVQAAAVVLCLILALLIFKIRKCKVIAASLWTMLEMVLLGAVVLYSTVFLRYVEPQPILCLLEPWFRELGFSVFYGAIILKVYRSLVDHRTRKAHRYIIRDRDLLKYLAGLVVFVTGYLAAWSALTAHLAAEGHSPLVPGRTPHGLPFTTCRSVWWEYVTEAGELLFVMFGLYLAWHLHKAAGGSGSDSGEGWERRSEAGEVWERRGLTWALLLEVAASTPLYIARHLLWLSAHPDIVFLAYFARTHLTVTISLVLILLPKLWRAGSGGGRDLPRRTYSTTAASEGPHELRFCDVLTNGDLEASDVNLSQMDPEEIRAELKRVYTQLEVLRTKTMRKDNPHISKRRGGRKATHRRFSLQSRKGSREKSFHRHHQRTAAHAADSGTGGGGGDGGDNKTPEESVCSVEGPSVLSIYPDGPSDLGTPSILHRSYKL